jgi:hypothetical protein
VWKTQGLAQVRIVEYVPQLIYGFAMRPRLSQSARSTSRNANARTVSLLRSNADVSPGNGRVRGSEELPRHL